MKFQLIVTGLFIFYTYVLRTSKSIGNNTMKKMLLATGNTNITDVLNRRLLFKTNRRQWHQKKPSPIISSFLELGEENCRCSQICGGAENIC